MLTEEQRLRNRERTRAWCEANPEKKKELDRQNYLKHRAARLEKGREYATKNKEKIKQYSRAYRGLPEPTRLEPTHCECCGRLPGRSGRLELDHCHETGAFRGWLCHRCNLGLGNLGDTKQGLLKALEYLERAECQIPPPSPSPIPTPASNSGT